MAKPKERGLTPDEIRERIRTARSMQALQEAKRWAKEHPGREADDLLAEAYGARIDAFARSGMRREVDELLKVARERLPAHAAEWERRAGASAWRTGNVEGVLREWARADLPEDRRREIAALVERELRDPAHLLHDALPVEDPLRVAAAAVTAALREAADGALSAAAREGLQQVGRRSPLAPWRGFVLALAAFHAGDDASCRSLLASLPPGSAVAKLTPVLLAELDREPRQDTGPVEKSLVTRLHGKAGDLIAKAVELRSALERQEKAAARRALEALLSGLVPGEVVLAERLVLWLVRLPGSQDWIDEEALEGSILARLPRDEVSRLEALIYGDPLTRWIGLASWLLPKPDAPLRPLSEVALAQALDFLVELTGELWMEARLELDLRGDPERRMALTVPGVRGLLEVTVLPIGLEMYLHIQAQILAILRRRHAGRFEAEPLADPVVELILHRTILDPETEPMLACLRRMQSSRHGDPGLLLALWTEVAPECVDAWLELARHEHESGTPIKARKAIERAAALDSVNADVRSLQFEIALSVLRAHLKSGNDRLVRQDLGHLRALPAAATPERKRYLKALACVHAKTTGDAAAAPAEWPAPTPSPEDRFAALSLASTEVSEGGGKSFATPAGTTPEEKWASLARLVALAEAVDHALLDRISAGELLEAARPEHLPAERARLLAICRFARRVGAVAAEYAASGAGMRDDAPELGRLLVHRACALLAHDRARARNLVRLALDSAQGRRDATLARYIATVAPHLPGRDAADSYVTERGDGLLASERAAAPTLAERRAPPARPERKRRTPRRRREGPFLPFDRPATEEQA